MGFRRQHGVQLPADYRGGEALPLKDRPEDQQHQHHRKLLTKMQTLETPELLNQNLHFNRLLVTGKHREAGQVLPHLVPPAQGPAQCKLTEAVQ